VLRAMRIRKTVAVILEKSIPGFSERISNAKEDGQWLIFKSKEIGGVGTELKRILKNAGFDASDCQCDVHAAEMDAKGIAWCRTNTGTIVGWLADAAKERGFPFSRTAGHLLVWAAIAAARRKSPLANEKRAE